MKKSTITMFAVLMATAIFSQPPQAFKYQTVVRDAAGDILSNQMTGFRMSVHDGTPSGTVVYQETHIASTNAFGLVSLEIGTGSPTIGSFVLIDWSSGSKYLETEIDPAGGTAFQTAGTTQLLSVPYALFADRATFGNDNDWIISGNHMYADIPGNVGIGLTNPENAKLEVIGDMITGIEVSSFMSNGITSFSSGGGGFAAGFFHAVSPGTYGIWTQSAEYDALHASTLSPTSAAIRASGTYAGIFEGKVGIGTSNPGRLLHVYSEANPRILVESNADQAPEVNLKRGSTTYAMYVNTDNDLVFYQSGDRFTLTDNGNIGIGTTTPSGKLHIVAPSSSWGMLRIENSNTGKNEASISFREGSDVSGPDTWLAGVGLYGNQGEFIIGRDGERLSIDPNGNVGIGTSGLTEKTSLFTNTKEGKSIKAISHQLTVGNTSDDNVLRLVGPDGSYGHGARFNFGDGDLVYIEEDLDDYLYIYATYRTAVMGGNVGIGTTSAAERLTVRGNIRVESETTGQPVVELGEGLDYAEGFDVSLPEALQPGNVLIIDPDNPGELTLSTKPYDSKVAGIVAGANELGSGVKLGAGQFDCNVALAGRVYCNVDAKYGSVAPGDLLTTSATPGYAMAVKDPSQAHGAVLGKAMEPLENGEKGQILVLVTLQ